MIYKKNSIIGNNSNKCVIAFTTTIGGKIKIYETKKKRISWKSTLKLQRSVKNVWDILIFIMMYAAWLGCPNVLKY